jgi:hypothetical protein
MDKFKLKLFSLVVVGILVSLFSATANAQFQLSAKDQQFFTNNPCSDPHISWALWNESAGINRPTGGIGTQGDCDPSNFGSWSTGTQLESNLQAYRQLLARQGLKLTAFQGRDGNAYVAIARPDGILLGINAGHIIASGGGNIIASGGGNFVPAATIIASGGGNIIASGGGNIIASGGGNFYGVKAVGDTVVQLPGKWVKMGSSNPTPAPQQPNNPYNPPATNRSAMVQTSYQRAFGRAPSSAELAYWNGLPASDSRVGNINTLIQSHQAYLRSNQPERQATINRSYMTVFRRNTNSGEMQYWDQQVASTGATYEQLVGLHQQYKAQHPNFR